MLLRKNCKTHNHFRIRLTKSLIGKGERVLTFVSIVLLIYLSIREKDFDCQVNAKLTPLHQWAICSGI